MNNYFSYLVLLFFYLFYSCNNSKDELINLSNELKYRYKLEQCKIIPNQDTLDIFIDINKDTISESYLSIQLDHIVFSYKKKFEKFGIINFSFINKGKPVWNTCANKKFISYILARLSIKENFILVNHFLSREKDIYYYDLMLNTIYKNNNEIGESYRLVRNVFYDYIAFCKNGKHEKSNVIMEYLLLVYSDKEWKKNHLEHLKDNLIFVNDLCKSCKK